MRRALLALAICLPAAPALAQVPPQFVCSGRAEGQRGEAVSVLIHVEPDGRRAASYATWDPPVAATTLKGGFEQPELSLYLPFDAATKTSPGMPGAAAVALTVLSDFRKPEPVGKLNARLDALAVRASLDGTAATPVAMAASPVPDMPGTATRSGTIALPRTLPAQIAVTVADTKGKPLGTVSFDLADSAGRDALYARAWTQAETAAADFTKCEQTATGD